MTLSGLNGLGRDDFVEAIGWVFEDSPWIAVDVLAIGLFAWRGLLITSALYALFLTLAIAGLIQWQRKARTA